MIDAALGAGNYKTASVSTTANEFEKAKIQFHGKPIGDQGVRAFLAVDCFEEDRKSGALSSLWKPSPRS